MGTGKKVVANGDIKMRSQIDELERIGLYGAMLGRAAVVNPHIFSELKGGKGGSSASELPITGQQFG